MSRALNALCMGVLLLSTYGCTEYEVVEIKEEVTEGPLFFNIPDNQILKNPEKNIGPPTGPGDRGDPLIPDIEVSFIQYDFGTLELTDTPQDVVLEILHLGKKNIHQYILNSPPSVALIAC